MADFYDVDAEPDQSRAAAYIIAELVATALLQPYRRQDATAALRGDIGNLYVWERSAIAWLKRQVERDPATIMNAWTYSVVRAACT